jgi:cytochrome c-type biogenesis protein CcmH
MKAYFAIIGILLFPLTTLAVDPGEILKDSKLEKRARAISKGLRCVVCQNQSIDDSDAQLARDLRILVRNRILVGDSDTAVLDYVVSRYGDFVLLKPPVKGVTLVLWFGPILITFAGLIGLILFYRRQKIRLNNLIQLNNKENKN